MSFSVVKVALISFSKRDKLTLCTAFPAFLARVSVQCNVICNWLVSPLGFQIMFAIHCSYALFVLSFFPILIATFRYLYLIEHDSSKERIWRCYIVCPRSFLGKYTDVSSDLALGDYKWCFLPHGSFTIYSLLFFRSPFCSFFHSPGKLCKLWIYVDESRRSFFGHSSIAFTFKGLAAFQPEYL